MDTASFLFDATMLGLSSFSCLATSIPVRAIKFEKPQAESLVFLTLPSMGIGYAKHILAFEVA